MATINVSSALVGQPTRPPVLAESGAAQRAGPRNVSASAAETELAQSAAGGASAVGHDDQAVGIPPPPPAELDRAVEEANTVAASALNTVHRSVEFGRDEASGRMTISITEEKDGETVTRQIPPAHVLELVKRLKALTSGGEGDVRGILVDLDG